MSSDQEIAGYKLRPRKNLRKKRISLGDGSSSEEEDVEVVVEFDSDEEDVFDEATFKKMLHHMFPSKNMKNKITEMDAITEKMDKADAKKGKRKTKRPIKSRLSKARLVEESSSDENGSGSESDFETVDEDDSEFEDGEPATINIVLTINDEMFDTDDSNDEDYEPDSSGEEEEEEEEEDERPVKSKSKRSRKYKAEERGLRQAPEAQLSNKVASACPQEEEEPLPIIDIEKEKALLTKLEAAVALLEKDETTKGSAVFAEMKTFAKNQKARVEKYTKKFEKKDKKKNLKEFKSLLSTRRENNELVYFTKLPLVEQRLMIEKMKDANKYTKIDKPYRFKLLEMDIPEHIKAVALKKMSTFQRLEPGSGEYSKLKQWIDAFMAIPFNVHKNFDLSLEASGPEKCRGFMESSTKILDDAVFGLNDAKMQIMQMIGTWISNPAAIGSAIAIKGPPGTGKTTLVKEGISKVLQRPFSFIALGGSTDSSFLEGHGYTYEGSTWGKIVSILMECKCMNPVIYFDELDKVSETPKGEEIIGILTHLIDTSQNTEYRDKYFSEVKFDLSKCLFIFSYNDETKINPILRDRMYKIETKGYDAKEKSTIAKIHLLPSIRKQIKFTEEELVISDEVIAYIVQNFTGEEKGVRNLKRCLEIIFTKMNLYRFTDTTTEFFKKGMLEKVEFPYTLSNRDVDKLVSKKELNTYLATMYT
jgi:ATP-dependent Lon protease